MSYSSLNFDYESIRDQVLNKVIGTAPLLCNNGSTVFDCLSLVCDRSTINISVNDDSDELIIEKNENNHIDKNSIGENFPVEGLASFVGSRVGWCWIGRNYLGYYDAFVISFSGIEPQIMLYGAASKVNLYRMEPI